MSGYLVVDASVALKLVVPEEDTEIADQLYSNAGLAQTVVLVPPHLLIEITNALRKKVWRLELTHDEAVLALRRFLRLEIEAASPPGLYERALELANRYNRRAVYDSHYVALAAIFGCDLWTADTGIVNVMAGDLPFIRLLKNYE